MLTLYCIFIVIDKVVHSIERELLFSYLGERCLAIPLSWIIDDSSHAFLLFYN